MQHVETIKNDPADDNSYSMFEAIADIALHTTYRNFITNNSRMLIDYIITWATEFEKINNGVLWGVDTDLDYIEAIEKFTNEKIEDAIKNDLGYIDEPQKFKLWDKVIAPEPDKNDYHSSSFIGSVIGFGSDGNILIEDDQGWTYEIKSHRLKLGKHGNAVL